MEQTQKFIYLTAITILFGAAYLNAANIGSSQIDALKSQFLPPEFKNTNFTIDDIKKIFREKCKKAIGTHNATVYKEIEEGAKTFQNCLSDLVNVTLIQEEVAAARPMGDLDTVFHKYCQKAPELEKCILKFNSKVQPCLTKAEYQQNTVLMRIVGTLMKFMCSKGGDQMALFIAEEGPECLEANKEAITNCANHSFIDYWPKDGQVPDIFNLPEIVLSPDHCIDFERFEACTIHHLEQCREITPANVAGSIFNFVKNETSCKKWIDAKANQRSVLKDPRDGGAAAMKSFSFMIIAAAAGFIAFLRLGA